tara:strand:- start:20 stop:262 length:243 start_codon:yes stop_codon:yes gene_type:complete
MEGNKRRRRRETIANLAGLLNCSIHLRPFLSLFIAVVVCGIGNRCGKGSLGANPIRKDGIEAFLIISRLVNPSEGISYST